MIIYSGKFSFDYSDDVSFTNVTHGFPLYNKYYHSANHYSFYFHFKSISVNILYSDNCPVSVLVCSGASE